MCNS